MTLGSCLSYWTVCGLRPLAAPATRAWAGFISDPSAGSYAGLGAESTIDWAGDLRRKTFCTVL
jgi:hypothetical protein